MHSCSASSGKPDSDSLECIVFSCFLVYHDWNRWSDEGFTFLMYLHHVIICCCRYSFGSWCICTTLIFSVADALSLPNVSATCSSLNLQILFSLLDLYNCIYILLFLGFKDTSFANFASTSHVFDNVWMLLIKILHLQSPQIHYLRYLPKYPLRSICFTDLADTWLTKKLI